jgi:DUF1365 family protein
MKSCIYRGYVGHSRRQPVVNRFRYSLFMMYLDLDELEHLFKERIFWSVGRPNIAWFRRRDYLGDPDIPLDTAIRILLNEQLGINHEGPIRILTHLRYFGHNFNPVTFYYCFDQTGSRVETIVANITNTPWGERYSYVLDGKLNIGTEKEKHFRFRKSFHVSPFLDMDMEYDWRFSDPGDELRVQMTNFREKTQLFKADLNLKKLELNGRNLARMLITYPPMTLKVVAGIYWQALRLRMKGAKFYTHPEKRGKA